jgi:hypothetical protein
MPSVHHDSAYEALVDLADETLEPAEFRVQLSEIFPGWQANAFPMQGYKDEHHHASLMVGRCLHDCLPAPFNALKYDWEREHGFTAVMSWVDQHGRTAAEIKTLVTAAVAQCEKVMNDR